MAVAIVSDEFYLLSPPVAITGEHVRRAGSIPVLVVILWGPNDSSIAIHRNGLPDKVTVISVANDEFPLSRWMSSWRRRFRRCLGRRERRGSTAIKIVVRSVGTTASNSESTRHSRDPKDSPSLLIHDIILGIKYKNPPINKISSESRACGLSRDARTAFRATTWSTAGVRRQSATGDSETD
ncbi:hypothetical protein HSEST_0124 [Halapricum desulfuricans]|uniref:Uncharacterized protein n=1 Tax=Halapricum desulfuricans TaxID=2841257 RepID=A0A897NN52_9EURY|nr:hypothetical protein HSEST_0124 [Halapricum desulfuricans]